MTERSTNSTGGFCLAISLVAFGSLALFFSRDIERTGFGGNHDPGPRFVPVVLAACLVFWGLLETVRLLVGMWRRVDMEQPDDEFAGDVSAPTTNRWNLVIVMAAVCIYIPAISWLGFSLSTFLLASGLIVWLGGRWWVAPIVSVVMVGVVKVLFSNLFKVQLPTGDLGLPF
jgi:hypothetical protein